MKQFQHATEELIRQVEIDVRAKYHKELNKLRDKLNAVYAQLDKMAGVAQPRAVTPVPHVSEGTNIAMIEGRVLSTVVNEPGLTRRAIAKRVEVRGLLVARVLAKLIRQHRIAKSGSNRSTTYSPIVPVGEGNGHDADSDEHEVTE